MLLSQIILIVVGNLLFFGFVAYLAILSRRADRAEESGTADYSTESAAARAAD